MSEPEARLAALVRASPTLMAVLALVRAAGLPDWRVFSGAIYQTAWNALTGRASDYGIKDYDVGYFDTADISYEAEDRVIRRVAALRPNDLCPGGLREAVQVRNQARVHLWFEDRFGEAYPPLANTDEALGRFICPAFAAGVRLEADDGITVAAPFGLEDLFALRLRPNPTRPKATHWEKATQSAAARWPEVSILA